MKHKNAVLLQVLLPVFIFSMAGNAIGQCAGIKVTHTSGTQQVGCTEVTVTSDGSVDVLSPAPCNYGPFWVGRFGSGSYTFTFSSPVQGVMIDVQTLDNHSGSTDEMVIDVNGTFYPITVPGSTDGCFSPAIIWPPGTVRGPVGGHGSWRDIYIPGPINEIKVANNWVEGTPLGFFINMFVCCSNCTTDAGAINASPFQVCSLDPAVVPPAEQTNLDPDDLLQYIVFSNPGNPLSTIIATSNSPSLVFNPATMTAGTTYYIAAIAGNGVGGNVDITDPCLSISNAVEVIWMPTPIVSFFSSVSCVKPGECYDINVFLLGTPPFQMTGQVVLGSNVIATFGGTYNGLSAVEVVCIPISAPMGPVTIEALSLSDTFCTCD